ncbi:MAG: T9SS type A sorting domain-containing protein, partial [Bacteroidia bacterium]
MKTRLLILAFIICSFKINYAQTTITIYDANDSLDMYGCGVAPYVYTEFNILATTSGYNDYDTVLIKVLFGDGTYSTRPYVIGADGAIWGYGYATHTYLSSDVFDVTYVVTGPDGNADTLFHPAEVITNDSCDLIRARVYLDNNSNCIYDAGDSIVSNVRITLKNGISTYWYFPFIGGWNRIDAPLGYNFTVYADVSSIQNLGYTLTCPASGFINFNHNGPDTLYFAINCNSDFDLSAISSANNFKIGNSALIGTAVSNITCIPQSGTYTVTLDPNLSYVTAYTPPASIVGNIITWNFTNLGSTCYGTNYPSAYNMFYVNMDPFVQIGDTLCYTFSVAPTTGDFNPANNSVTMCYQVKSAWDPNYKDVSPHGQGISGAVLPGTEFTYTIGFQNTGNDTAKDVYLIDTLDANLDINTLEILFATHPMQFSIINGNVLRFQFDHIMLPDSNVNEMLSHGFVGYKIKHKQGIPNGTQIFNTAYIYFDQNPAVVTNTTLNTIDATLGIKENDLGLISLYPNPVNNFLTIKLINDQQREIIITDVLGKEVLHKEVLSKEVLIDVNKIPNGIYF